MLLCFALLCFALLCFDGTNKAEKRGKKTIIIICFGVWMDWLGRLERLPVHPVEIRNTEQETLAYFYFTCLYESIKFSVPFRAGGFRFPRFQFSRSQPVISHQSVINDERVEVPKLVMRANKSAFS
jgi:hypothetical protein